MKKNTTSFVAALLLLFSINAFGAEHVTLSASNCVQTGDSSMTIDLYIVNDGDSALKLNSILIGFNVGTANLNGGALSWVLSGSSDLPSYITDTYTYGFSSALNQLTVTSSAGAVGAGSAPSLPFNVPVKIGTFTITNTKPWTPASSTGLWAFNTTSGGANKVAGFAIYMGVSAGITNFNTFTNRALSITCSVTFAGACTPPSLPTAGNDGPKCSGSTINLTSSAGAGTAPFTYSWAGPNSYVSSTQDSTITAATVAATGTYSVTITNACGSTNTTTVVTVNSKPTAGITNNTGATALNCSRTSINLTATGSGTYSWSSGLGTNAAVSVTVPNTYTVTVTGGNGCTATSSIVITQNITPPTPGITNNSGITILTCAAPSISLIATGTGTYSWSGGLGSNPAVNVIAPNTYTVTVTGANGCSATSSITITQNITPPTADIDNNTGTTVLTCSITSIILTASGNGTYSWSAGLGTDATVTISSPDSYTVTVTADNGCTTTASATLTQLHSTDSVPICMVTVDSVSMNNIITWSKPGPSLVDSFIVYREITANNYQRIGAVANTGFLSIFTDTARTKYFPNTGDPNEASYHYKLQVRDTCGNYSELSPYHNTIYLSNNNDGTFSWTEPYTIEGASDPVTSYDLMRDDLSNGNWQIVNSVAGSQDTISDPDYDSFKATARWRVQTGWGISCTPALRLSSASVFNTSLSNSVIVNTVGIKGETTISNNLILYPNPATNRLTIRIASSSNRGQAMVSVKNMLGESMQEEKVKTTDEISINIQTLPAGIYFVQVSTENERWVKRFVKE